MSAASLLDLLPAALSAHLIPARRLEEKGGDKRGFVATALPQLDALLGGGWPRGVVSELAGPRSSGRTSILHASLAGALKGGGVAALVDAEQAFDARLAARAGVPLARLLWVHAPGTQALRAAELLIDAGGFDLVALDEQLHSWEFPPDRTTFLLFNFQFLYVLWLNRKPGISDRSFGRGTRIILCLYPLSIAFLQHL